MFRMFLSFVLNVDVNVTNVVKHSFTKWRGYRYM